MTNNNRKKIKIHHTSPADENNLALKHAERILQGDNYSLRKRNGKK
jgi:hypothetical protein